MKKFLVAFMTVLLLLPELLNTSVQAANNLEVKQQVTQQQTSEFDLEDIMALESYISVENGLFEFDSSLAEKDGHNKKLVEMQRDYLYDLNNEVKEGKIKIENDLEITSLTSPVIDNGFSNLASPMINKGFSTLASCKGKSTALDYHWWGISRYLNSCQANKFSADMTSVATGYGAAGIAAAYWFPGVGVAVGIVGAYAGLLAARVSANNSYGKGVYVGITYAGFFDVDSQ